MEQPLVSIVIPVYNAAPDLARCIESVRKQTYRNIEVFLVNDGSKDASSPICHMYERIDPRVHVIDKENAGVSAARNTGIAAAQGKYIHGNDQASPLSEAVDPLCGGKIFHCPAHILLVDLRQRLANGRHVRGIQLFAHVGNAVLRQDLSIDADLVIRRRGAAGLCKGQFEIIVTGKAQRTAEP